MHEFVTIELSGCMAVVDTATMTASFVTDEAILDIAKNFDLLSRN